MKSIHKKIVLFSFFAVALGLFGFARFDDSDILKKIAGQLNKWAETCPAEKVYLQIDKPYYAVGDDIWFKAYVTAGSAHKLSAMSGILNVELINPADSVVKLIKLPLTYGLTWGDFKLTDSLTEGNYRLRAYTNYMRNAGDAYFFDKTIAIGKAINNDINASVNYSYSNQNGKPVVAADITYTNGKGSAYAVMEVLYEVKIGPNSIARGKALTDADGKIHLSFSNPAMAANKAGFIETSLKTAARQYLSKTIPFKSTTDRTDVQFFPESGNLLNGFRNKIAFKAVGSDGLGRDIKGTVTDNDHQQVAEIKTQHLGMGSFILTPVPGQLYTAHITYPDGSEGTFNLPKASDEGYLLSINNSDSTDVIVRVAIGDATFTANQNHTLSLVAQSGGTIVYTAQNKIESRLFSARIPKKRFPAGVTQFTLFTETGEPLNERLVFIGNDDGPGLAISTNKTSYQPREKVKLDISVKNNPGQPVVGSYSIAVTDESKVPFDEDADNTILSNLLLTSDLNGYIEKPGFYFNHPTPQTNACLDVLMLTQGYRRFVWKQLMDDHFPAQAFMAEKGLTVSGQIHTFGGKAIQHGKVSLLNYGKSLFMLDTLSDEQGRFSFPNLWFTDSLKFVIQARTAKDRRNVDILMDKNTLPGISSNKNMADVQLNVNSAISGYLKNSEMQYTDWLSYGLVMPQHALKTVNIREQRKPTINSSNLNGAGVADQVIKSDKFQSCATLSQCLQTSMYFTTFRGGVPYSNRSPGVPMGLVVDGMQMDISYLDDINPGDVESVEVLRSGGNLAIYGSQGAGGLILVNMKRGGSIETLRNVPGITVYHMQGYYKAREFYSPKYDDPKTNTKVADLRTTIYWKPDIIIGKTGASPVEYFNADTRGTYKVVLEGIDADGKISHVVYRYKVASF